MSGKPFEHLRNKRLHKHKVLLPPSTSAKDITVQVPAETPLSPDLKGPADPSASHPAEMSKFRRIWGESTIWLKMSEVKTSIFKSQTLSAEKDISNLFFYDFLKLIN